MKPMSDKQFEQQLKETLEESLETIDPQVQYQLQIARAKVLDQQIDAVPWYRHWYIWASITGLASVCMLVFSLLSTVTEIEPFANSLTSEVDSNLFDGETSIELYEEYDFYVWLSQQEANT